MYYLNQKGKSQVVLLSDSGPRSWGLWVGADQQVKEVSRQSWALQGLQVPRCLPGPHSSKPSTSQVTKLLVRDIAEGESTWPASSWPALRRGASETVPIRQWAIQWQSCVSASTRPSIFHLWSLRSRLEGSRGGSSVLQKVDVLGWGFGDWMGVPTADLGMGIKGGSNKVGSLTHGSGRSPGKRL